MAGQTAKSKRRVHAPSVRQRKGGRDEDVQFEKQVEKVRAERRAQSQNATKNGKHRTIERERVKKRERARPDRSKIRKVDKTSVRQRFRANEA